MTGCGDISGTRTLVSVDVGSARVEIVGDVSKFAGEVARELNSILAGMRLRPVEVDGDFRRAEDSASDAADSIEKDFQDGADRSEDALAGVDEDFQEPRQNANQAAESIASDFESAGSRARRALSGAAKFMAGAIAGVAAAATAAASAVAGVSLTRGFSRLADIEDAEAKLRGLGHTGDSVRQIMDDAMEAVSGTIFGFNEMAGVAANIVGAGIQPGREPARTLKAIADASQIGGEGLTEMGDIIGQVAVAGRASMDEINRMQARGIPILSWLAEQMGVTAEEARKMVSAGEVSFRDFRQAIEDNIGGAALEAADTTRGAWDNMVFTFTRTGAALLSGVFPTFKEVFNGIAAAMAPVEQLANQVGRALGAALDAFRSGKGLQGAIDAFRESLDPEVFNSATSAIRDMVSNGFQFLRDNAADIAETLINTFAAGRDAVLGAISNIGERLPELVPQLVSALVGLVKNLVNTLKTNIPLILNAAKDLIVGLAEGIVNSKDIVFDAIEDIIDSIADFIEDPAGLTAVVNAAVGIIEALVQGLVDLVTSGRLQTASLKIIVGLANAIMALIPQVIFLGQELLLALIDGILNALEQKDEETGKTTVETIMAAIEKEIPKLIDSGAKMLEKILEGFLDLMDRSRETAKRLIEVLSEKFEDDETAARLSDAAVEIMQLITDALVDNIDMITTFITETFIPEIERMLNENPELIDAGVDVMVAILEGMVRSEALIAETIVTKVIPAIVLALASANAEMTAAGGRLAGQILSGLWNTWRTKSGENLTRVKNNIINFFNNADQWLRDAGSRVISGLINGIRSRFEDVQNTLGILTSMLPSWKGPAELDRRILRDAGRQVMEGFQAGIQDERGNVERLLRGITTDMGSIGTFTGRVQGGDGAASGAVSVTVAPGAVVIQGQDREAGERAAEAFMERLAQSVLVR